VAISARKPRTTAAVTGMPVTSQGRHAGGVISEFNGWPTCARSQRFTRQLPCPPRSSSSTAVTVLGMWKYVAIPLGSTNSVNTTSSGGTPWVGLPGGHALEESPRHRHVERDSVAWFPCAAHFAILFTRRNFSERLTVDRYRGFSTPSRNAKP
jgi:hypothetical protein